MVCESDPRQAVLPRPSLTQDITTSPQHDTTILEYNTFFRNFMFCNFFTGRITFFRFIDLKTHVCSQVNCDAKGGHKKESDFVVRDVEERTFNDGHIMAGITNLTGSYFLFKALLIYWIHVSILIEK